MEPYLTIKQYSEIIKDQYVASTPEKYGMMRISKGKRGKKQKKKKKR